MNSQEILFQLTNVGSTPVSSKNDTMTTPTSGSNTSSPRRWTELFSKKRAKTPSISTPSTSSSAVSSLHDGSPVRPGSKQSFRHFNIDSALQYPPVMQSPESYHSAGNGNGSGHGNVQVGKKPHRRGGNKSWKNEKCCICRDLCSFKGSTERVIILQCNHMCHEDCLMVSLNPVSKTFDLYDALPKCQMCSMLCVPSQEDMKQRLRNHLLTVNSSSSDQLSSAIPQLQSQLKPHNTPENTRTGIGPLAPPPPPLSMRNDVKTTATNRDIRLSFASSLKPPVFVTPSVRDSWRLPRASSIKRRSNNYRGSTISALSSITSSSSLYNDSQLVCSLHIQRQYFMQAFLTSFEEIKPWEIDSRYGLLRLIDNFLISLDDQGFKQCCCYLFSEYLLLCQPSSKASSNVLQFSSYRFLQLNSPANIELIDATTLELKAKTGERVRIKPFNSDTKSLEKWITAFFDPTLTFGNLDFTSIPLPDFVSAMPSAEDSRTIIVRRQNTINETIVTAGPRDSTLFTSISSILSIKRSTPRELNVILQVDRRKLKSENLITIKNVLSALTWKYHDFNCCIVGVDGLIVKIGGAREILDSWAEISDAGTQPFSPALMYKTWYKERGKVCNNAGVLVISNASMETGKTCLFHDYRMFANVGKRHVNELKIKVGFLNVDYTNKIKELVEIQDWNELLEAVSYSFNINFDDDDDDDDDEGDSDTSDSFSVGSSEFNKSLNSDNERLVRPPSPTSFEDIEADSHSQFDDDSELQHSIIYDYL